jgi:hypothetical protein
MFHSDQPPHVTLTPGQLLDYPQPETGISENRIANLRHVRIDPNDDSISRPNNGQLLGCDLVHPAALRHNQLRFFPWQRAIRNPDISVLIYADWRGGARHYV